jgi:hypothetical protein
MAQLSATRCSCIAILWVSPVIFAPITLCIASQRVFVIVSVYFVIDSVRKLLDPPSYVFMGWYLVKHRDNFTLLNFLPLVCPKLQRTPVVCLRPLTCSVSYCRWHTTHTTSWRTISEKCAIRINCTWRDVRRMQLVMPCNKIITLHRR